jgi:hypothetical protein
VGGGVGGEEGGVGRVGGVGGKGGAGVGVTRDKGLPAASAQNTF